MNEEAAILNTSIRMDSAAIRAEVTIREIEAMLSREGEDRITRGRSSLVKALPFLRSVVNDARIASDYLDRFYTASRRK